MPKLALIAGVAQETDDVWSCIILQADPDLPEGYDFLFGGGGHTQADALKLARSVMRHGQGGLYSAGPLVDKPRECQLIPPEALALVTFSDGSRCKGWYVAVAGFRLYMESVRASLARPSPYLDSPFT